MSSMITFSSEALNGWHRVVAVKNLVTRLFQFGEFECPQEFEPLFG
jgi:hypothetical protein